MGDKLMKFDNSLETYCENISKLSKYYSDNLAELTETECRALFDVVYDLENVQLERDSTFIPVLIDCLLNVQILIDILTVAHGLEDEKWMIMMADKSSRLASGIDLLRGDKHDIS